MPSARLIPHLEQVAVLVERRLATATVPGGSDELLVKTRYAHRMYLAREIVMDLAEAELLPEQPPATVTRIKTRDLTPIIDLIEFILTGGPGTDPLRYPQLVAGFRDAFPDEYRQLMDRVSASSQPATKED